MHDDARARKNAQQIQQSNTRTRPRARNEECTRTQGRGRMQKDEWEMRYRETRVAGVVKVDGSSLEATAL